ncbi:MULTISPECIES: class I SAM-dependent methyltransferase [Actinoalloteichus]|nr:MULTISPECIES: class I SAM-dependent methyltransferase [Actinoalloteichus]
MSMGEVFSAGHVEFSRWSPLLWEPLGEQLVRVSAPQPGEHVLDACAGAGASAIPAARAVGEHGSIDAVDLAERLLAEGRARAAELGLSNIRFTTADVTAWPAPDGGYDVVQCAYGIFFLPDMDRDVTRLVGLLRPGGRIVVSTWDEGAISPLPEVAMAAVRRERDLSAPVTSPGNPAGRVNSPAKLRDWLTGLGLRDVAVEQVPFRTALTPDLAWAMAAGSALRGVFTGLDEAALARVKADYLAELARREQHTLCGDSLIGVGVRG